MPGVAPAGLPGVIRDEVALRLRTEQPAQVIEEFAKNGYAPTATKKQFFLPMVLHRMLKSRAASAAMEAICRALGLTRLWGSPVIVRMEPRG